jgi:hypothetical protein
MDSSFLVFVPYLQRYKFVIYAVDILRYTRIFYPGYDTTYGLLSMPVMNCLFDNVHRLL